MPNYIFLRNYYVFYIPTWKIFLDIFIKMLVILPKREPTNWIKRPKYLTLGGKRLNLESSISLSISFLITVDKTGAFPGVGDGHKYLYKNNTTISDKMTLIVEFEYFWQFWSQTMNLKMSGYYFYLSLPHNHHNPKWINWFSKRCL